MTRPLTAQPPATRPTTDVPSGERCPDWCVRLHEDDDPPGHRFHQSSTAIVPVLTLRPGSRPVTAGLEPHDVALTLARHPGEVVDWVALEPLDGAGARVMITAESARGLADGLRALLPETLQVGKAGGVRDHPGGSSEQR